MHCQNTCTGEQLSTQDVTTHYVTPTSTDSCDIQESQTYTYSDFLAINQSQATGMDNYKSTSCHRRNMRALARTLSTTFTLSHLSIQILCPWKTGTRRRNMTFIWYTKVLVDWSYETQTGQSNIASLSFATNQIIGGLWI